MLETDLVDTPECTDNQPILSLREIEAQTRVPLWGIEGGVVCRLEEDCTITYNEVCESGVLSCDISQTFPKGTYMKVEGYQTYDFPKGSGVVLCLIAGPGLVSISKEDAERMLVSHGPTSQVIMHTRGETGGIVPVK